MGLPISEPSTSYQDLLGRVAPKNPQPTTPSHTASNWRSLINRWLDAVNPPKASSPFSAALAADKSLAQQTAESASTPGKQEQPDVQSVVDDNLRFEVETNQNGSNSCPESNADSQAGEPSDLSLFAGQEVPSHPFAETAPDADSSDELTPHQIEIVPEIQEPLKEDSVLLETVKSPQPPHYPHEAILAGFDQAFRELSAEKKPADIDFYSDQLCCAPEHDAVRMLFSAAERSLIDPEYAKRSSAALTASADRRLEASTLEKELKRVEKIIEAPWIGLKPARKGAHPAAPAPAPSDQIPPTFESATPGMRLRCFLLDFGYILICAIVLAVCYARLFEPSLKTLVLHPGNWNILTFLSLLGLVLAFLPMVSFLYLVVRLALFRQTIGEAKMKIQLSKSDGTPLDTPDILIRSACYLPSLILGGGVPVLFQKQALHDYLLDTMPARASATPPV